MLSIGLLFKMAPNGGAEVLSHIPKHKEAVICLIGKTLLLDKLCSSMNYHAAGHEINVSGSIIYNK